MLFIDGDVVKYRAGFGAERMQHKVVYTDPEFDEVVVIVCENKKEAGETLASDLVAPYADARIESDIIYEPVENALHNVKSIIDSIMERTDHDKQSTVVALSGATNFRLAEATIRPYKGNRDDARKPTHATAIVDYMINNYECEVSVDEEADDVLGKMHMAIYKDDPHGSIIATIDKDLDMIPGLHFNFVTGDMYEVSPEEAKDNFWIQMVTGDTTDNIVGVPKKGPAAANKLKENGELNYEGVLTLYVQVYGEDEGIKAFEENANLLWIRQEEDQHWRSGILADQ